MIDHQERKSANSRYCVTHALVSEMFSASAGDRTTAKAWAYNAREWATLAILRKRIEHSPAPPDFPDIITPIG